MRFLASCFVALSLLPPVVATPPDPLRLIPKDATLVLKVEKPRALIEAVTKLDAYHDYEALPQVRELLGSTSAKRFFQLLAHAETKLGKKWPDLLDKLATGGIAIGTVAGKDPAPTVLAMQGTDEATTKTAFALFVQLLNDELARQSNAAAPVKIGVVTKNGCDTVRLGNDFFAARCGAVVLVSNTEAGFDAALKLTAAKSDADSVRSHPTLPKAKALLGGDPLAWVWVDLVAAKQDKGLKDFLDTARKQIAVMTVLGGTTDAVRRSDFVTAGLFQTQSGLKLTAKLPAKRADLLPEFALHVPMGADQTGSLPLLEPPGVLYSQSFYLDLAKIWTERKTLLDADQLKDFEKGVADVSKLLPGTTAGKLLEMSGPHHRFVAVERGTDQYTTTPDVPLPEMALVSSMRDAQFGKTMATSLRTAAALASIQFGMKMTEETHDGLEIVSYRFAENKPLEADPTNLRYNFVPAFAVVNDSLVVATSPRLLKELIPELRKPIPSAAGSPAVWRNRLYGAGAAAGLKARPDPFITNAVLSQGIGRDEAKKQVDQLAKFLGTLGTLSATVDHAAEAFRFDVEWSLKK